MKPTHQPKEEDPSSIKPETEQWTARACGANNQETKNRKMMTWPLFL